MSKAKKMYDSPPTTERDEGGKLKVKKAEKSNAVQAGIDGMPQGTESPEMPMPARHAMAREQMHGRHETEHAAHDYGKGGDKSEMHERHHAEMKSLHKAHEKEMKSGVAREGGKAEPTKKSPEMPKGEKKAETGKAGEKSSEKKSDKK